MRPGARTLATIVAVLSPVLAAAHETLHEVQRGNAIAVKAYESDGEVLASAAYEVYSPADPRTPYQTGRTDRGGWLAFVPDGPGKWRVKVIEDTGHGLDLQVDAETPVGAPAAGAGVSSAAFVVRPLLGLAAIGAVFVGLSLAYRRKRPPT
jgi:nickel transport protein